MLAQHARRDARLVDGELVTLEHQDRSRWDRGAVDEALSADHAATAGCPGRYRLQAELALDPPARGSDAEDTDWRRIVAPLRTAARPAALAGGRAQPRGRGRHGRGPGRRAAAPRRARRRPRARRGCTCSRLPAPTCSPGPAGPPRRWPSWTARSRWRRPSRSAASWRTWRERARLRPRLLAVTVCPSGRRGRIVAALEGEPP